MSRYPGANPLYILAAQDFWPLLCAKSNFELEVLYLNIIITTVQLWLSFQIMYHGASWSDEIFQCITNYKGFWNIFWHIVLLLQNFMPCTVKSLNHWICQRAWTSPKTLKNLGFGGSMYYRVLVQYRTLNKLFSHFTKEGISVQLRGGYAESFSNLTFHLKIFREKIVRMSK